MGNSGSQTNQISAKQESELKWANSFPRNPPPPKFYQHKVLPERDANQKLRHTNNGDILQSGGTLSGRLHLTRISTKRHEKENYNEQPPRSYMSHERDPLHKYGHRRIPDNEYRNFRHKDYEEDIKRFGSAPDLRSPSLFIPHCKVKKKYKAPEPPNPNPEWDIVDRSNKKVRLFKTRAEMKRKQSSPLETLEPINQQKLNNRLSLPEMKRSQSMPDFQKELIEATQRLRNSKRLGDSKGKLKTLDHLLTKKDAIKQKIKEIELDVRVPGAGKESTPEKNSPIPEKQPKTFYFGMDPPLEKSNPKYSYEKNSSASDLSSEIDMDDCHLNTHGIALQLRPILPKKQLEIPRFSPAAAWKLLTSVESNTPGSTEASEEGSVFMENRIEKLSRPPPPAVQIGPRSNHDKSGDSGISGDAGPPIFEETPEDNHLRVAAEITKTRGISWTPEQDLGDDSSIEEGVNLEGPCKDRFGTRPHVFSLSLPRDNQLATYMGEKYIMQSNKGLQKLKRSLSGVLSTLGSKKENPSANATQEQNDNWLLSRSAPNSLNNGFNSLEIPKNEYNESPNSLLVPANNKQNTGRVMYLPQFDEQRNVKINNKILSRSAENIASEIKSASEPEDLQDPPKLNVNQWRSPNSKPKKFTFQSTVRQIERRRLAEKLSREAERKEKQRLRELEAMQRVEEEFQRKRAREKASIRQQLRLFSLDDSGWFSMPPNLEGARPEPDGAVSSSSSASLRQENKLSNRSKPRYASSSESSEEPVVKPPVTQVLSEYRQQQREYTEYTGSKRYIKDHKEMLGIKQTKVYPQVTCNMPKAKTSGFTQNGGSNYRKNFIHGVKSNRSAESTYSEDSHSNFKKNSPRVYRSVHSPITRF